MIITNIKSYISKHSSSFVAFLLSIVALVFALLMHPIYETNDDPGMESLLFGINGDGGTSFLVFINRILGIILYQLVSVFPFVNWYFIMHYSICLLSIFILIYVFSDKYKNVSLVVGIIVLSVLIEPLFLVQFTKTAALASLSGGIGLIYSTKNNKSITISITCIILLVLASMIRLSVLFSTCPFLLIVYFFEFLEMRKDNFAFFKNSLVTILISTALIILSCAIGDYINAQTPGIEVFNQYNYYRSNIQDYDYNSDTIASADSEVYMVAKWMNNDPDVFTSEKLKTLSNTYSSAQQVPNIHNILSEYLNYIVDMILHQHILIASIIYSAYVLVFSSGKKLYPFVLFLVYMVLELYLVYIGRYNIHRVDYGILISLFISIIYLSNAKNPCFLKMRKEFSKMLSILLCLTSILFLSVPSITLHKGFSDYFLSLHSSFIDACNDENTYYFIHPLAYDVDAQRNIYDVPQQILDNNYSFMGGWGSGIPIPGQETPENSRQNLWEQCIDNDNINLVLPSSVSTAYIKIIEWYIEEHYNSNVEGILVYENDNISVFRIVSA